MKKYLKKILLFFIAIFMFFLIKNIITPYNFGSVDYTAKLKEYKEKQDSINVVCFGSSRIYRHINPLILDSIFSNQKFHTYNLAVRGVNNPESVYLYTNFIERIDSGKINYAFIELLGFRPTAINAKSIKGNYFLNSEITRYSLNLIHSSSSENKLAQYKNVIIGSTFNFFELKIINNIIKKSNYISLYGNGFFSNDDALSKDKVLQEHRKDFLESDSEKDLKIRAEDANFPPSYYKKYPINQTHQQKLLELINKSKEKGIHLIFVIPPRLSEIQYKEILPVYLKLPNENKIALYQNSIYPEFYIKELSFDIGHLNTKGANIFTKKLAGELKKIIE